MDELCERCGWPKNAMQLATLEYHGIPIRACFSCIAKVAGVISRAPPFTARAEDSPAEGTLAKRPRGKREGIMNLTLARELTAERDYSLDLRESAWRKRMVCRLYACRGNDERYVCSISDLAKMAERAFRYKIAQLPEASEAVS